MNCQKIDFNSSFILQAYALRQNELRKPIGLNLFDEDLLSEQNELFFIGSEGNKLVCTLQFKIIDKEALKLRQMATERVYQGKGYGKNLVQFAEDWATMNGYKSIELHARKIAQGFYAKLDYRIVGVEFLEVEMPHFKMKKKLIENSNNQ